MNDGAVALLVLTVRNNDRCFCHRQQNGLVHALPCKG